MSDFLKINGHGHLLPYPEQIPRFMKEKKLFWVDADRKFMRQGDWKRPVTDPSFFLNEKLEWMDKNQISHEVVLNLSQLYCNGVERSVAKDIIQFQNDFNASLQQDYPTRFTSGFVVQPNHLEDAKAEIVRCVEELGMQLLCLPTHYLSDDQWKTTASNDLKEIWELANHYGIAVEIHPYDGQRMIQLQDQLWRFHLVWMCAQTADHYHFYTLYDFPTKYPNLRVCYAHGNQFGQMNVGRRMQGFKGRPDLFEGTVPPEATISKQNVFFDTLVHDVYSFRLLVDRQGTSQIVAGLDDPYPLGEMESVEGCYPGKVIDEAVAHDFITKEDRKAIWNKNVVQWLYGGDSSKFYARIKENN